jgi:type I restriction enzyme S subunit
VARVVAAKYLDVTLAQRQTIFLDFAEHKIINETKTKILEILRSELDNRSVGVFNFGSRARGNHREFSDFDIGLIGSEPIPVSTMNSLKEKLLESDIPFKVELIDFFQTSSEFKELVSESIDIWMNKPVVESFFKSLKK